MKTRPLHKPLQWFSAMAISLALVGTSAAVETLIINFSSAETNDLTAADGIALGADAYINVRTNQSGVTTTTDIVFTDLGFPVNLGKVTYQDYYQAGMKDDLGQPYATILGGLEITDPSFAPGLGAFVELHVGDVMAALGYSQYEVTLYYAGMTRYSLGYLIGAEKAGVITSGGSVHNDTLHIDTESGDRWSAYGETFTLTSGDLTISIPFVYNPFGNDTDQGGGLAAIRLTGVPEPGSSLLIALSGLALLRRRR